MLEFLDYLAKGNMTAGEKELAYNLTVIYGMSILCMVLLHRMFTSSSSNSATSNNQAAANKDQALSLIKKRRSVMPKDYSGEEVTKDEIDLLLEAANWAPTHHKSEPWRYVVIQGGQGVSDYLDMIETWYSDHQEEIPDQEYQQYLKKISGCKNVWPGSVSHLIVIGMVRQALPDKKLPEWEEICSVATSVQNMHLALTSVPGLAGFWSSHTWCRSFRDSGDMRQFCGLQSDEDRVFGCFVLGRVDQSKTFKSNRRDISEKVIWK